MLHMPVKNNFIGVIKINYLSILFIASLISLATSEEMFHSSGWNELSTDSETGDDSARISKFSLHGVKEQSLAIRCIFILITY